MGGIPKGLWAWLKKLLPQQKLRGDYGTQIGKVEGDVHLHQTHSADVHHHQHGHVHIEKQIVVLSPQQPPPSRPVGPLQDFQLKLLRYLAQNALYEPRALRFMRREFGTDRVRELDSMQCERATRYVDACIRNDAEKMAFESEGG